MSPSETVRDVKVKLQAQTHVALTNQKIMGWLPKGKVPEDKVSIFLSNFIIFKFTTIKTRTKNIFLQSLSTIQKFMFD